MRTIRVMAMTAALAVGAACLAVSEVAAQGQYVQVVTITVRPGTAGSYADYLVRVKEAADRIGDPRTVAVYRPVMGGSPFRFQMVTPFDDFSEVEDWIGPPAAILTEAYGEDEARSIREEVVRDAVLSVDNSIHVLQPDFSSNVDAPSSGQEYVRIVTTRVAPSGNADYSAALRATKAAEEELGIKRNRWTRNSGESFTHTATWFSDTISGLAAPGPPTVLADAHGDDVGGDLWARANAGVQSRTFETWRYAPDLSRGPM